MKKKSSKNIVISRKTTLKVIALIFSVVFWVYVMDQVNPEVVKVYNDVKIEIVGIEQIYNDGFVLMDDKDYFVKVTVKGRRNDILNFDESYLKITADVRGYGKGINTVPLDKRVLSESINIIDISNTEIKIELDKIVSISKPIVLENIGKLNYGYALSSITLDREEMIVEGPESKVNKISSLHGEINLDNKVNNFETNVDVVPVDNDNNQVIGVKLLDSKVNCSVEINKTKTVDITLGIMGEVKEGYKISKIVSEPKNVLIKGNPDVVDIVKSIYTEELDISGFDESFEGYVLINIPQGIDVILVGDSIFVKIEIEKIESKEFSFNINEIPIINLGDKLESNIDKNDGTIKLVIFDIRSKLDKIKRDELELVLDASSLEAGEYELEVQVISDLELEEYSLSKKTIDIILSDID